MDKERGLINNYLLTMFFPATSYGAIPMITNGTAGTPRPCLTML
jgi:hypothetical protein